MPSVTAADGRTYQLIDSNQPGQVIEPTLINGYSVLTIPAFWRACNFLANNLASFRRSVQINETPLDGVAHQLDRLLRGRPNTYQSAWIFWTSLFFDAVRRGNGYAKIDRIGTTPAALHNMPAADVVPFRIRPDGQPLQQWYYRRSTKEAIAGDDVIHLAGLSVDGMAGLDTVELQHDTFQRAKTLDKYQLRFLMKGTVISGAVEIPTGIDPDMIEQIKGTIRAQFRGADAEDDVLILSDGATLKNATLTPQQSQIIEQTAHTTKQIAQLTGVPPAFLYELSEGKYNASVEQAGIDVVTWTFRPWIEQAEAELSAKLLSEKEQLAGYAVDLDPAALMKADTAGRTAAAIGKKNAGITTGNEARKELGIVQSRDPEADKLKTSGDTTAGKHAAGAADPKAAA